MLPYISLNPTQSDVLPLFEGSSLIDRRALLCRLLAERHRPRILCAPPYYGKTSLAFQYAQLASRAAGFMWVTAGDPRFLYDLVEDALDVDRFSEGSLVVFDGLSIPTKESVASFVAFAKEFCAAGIEVLVTTRMVDFASERPDCSFFSAQDMALDEQESLEVESRIDRFASAHLSTVAPGLIFDERIEPWRFVRALEALPSSVVEACALCALALGAGPVSLLTDLFGPLVEEGFREMARSYPFAGVDAKGRSFHAFPLEAQHRFHLLSSLSESLADWSTLSDEHAFLQAIASDLKKRDEHDELDMLLSSCLRESSCRVVCREIGHPEGVCQLDWAARKGSFDPSVSVSSPAVSDPGSGQESDRSSGPGVDEALRLLSRLESLTGRSGGGDQGLALRLFGRFEAARGGRLLPEEGEMRRKARTMLGILAVNRDKEVPRVWLQRSLWPDADAERARSSFYNLWSYVRRTLEIDNDEAFRSRRSRDTITLRGLDLVTDVDVANKLCSSIGEKTSPVDCVALLEGLRRVYRGSLMPGVVNPDIDSYRASFRNRVLDAFVRGIEVLRANGHSAAALEYARFAFTQDTTREDVCCLFAELQKSLGQFASAISTVMSCRRALVDRFGIDGSRRLDDLYTQILDETSKERM